MTARDAEPLTQEQRATLAAVYAQAHAHNKRIIGAAVNVCDAYTALRAQHEALQAQMAALMPALRFALVCHGSAQPVAHYLEAAFRDEDVAALRAAVERAP